MAQIIDKNEILIRRKMFYRKKIFSKHFPLTKRMYSCYVIQTPEKTKVSEIQANAIFFLKLKYFHVTFSLGFKTLAL